MICPKCKKEVPEGKFCDLCGFELSTNKPEETKISTEENPPKPPTAIKFIPDKYELLKEIGRGGMGIVYEAMNKEINKRVAIKKMRDELAINPRNKERFLEEARRVAQLHHQNIVDIYDMFEQDNIVYIVFEYVDGNTVEEILNKKMKLSLEDTKKITLSVCEALNFAHSQRVVHRDIKPSNIMIVNPPVSPFDKGGIQEGFVKVMDFGIAREAKNTILRLTGKDTSGAPSYMSPEQHMGNYDERSDIYSLGITIYEMLTGDLPFKGPDFLVQKERMAYRPIKELIPEIPELVNEIINKCLQANKEDRYKTVKELSNDIKKI